MTNDLKNKAKLWAAQPVSGVKLFQASFQSFSFKKHAHDEFAVGVMDWGAQFFELKNKRHEAYPGALITVNPDEIHDGAALSALGYGYRIVYLDASLVQELLSDWWGKQIPLRFFTSPVVHDLPLASSVGALFKALDTGNPTPLFPETFFAQTIVDLFRKYGEPEPLKSARSDLPAIQRVCTRMNDDPAQPYTLDEVSKEAGISKFHFIRVFRASTGMSPTEYLYMQRVRFAKKQIEGGASPAQTAVMSGFSDQSHLNKRFKSMTGISPGQYKKAFQRDIFI